MCESSRLGATSFASKIILPRNLSIAKSSKMAQFERNRRVQTRVNSGSYQLRMKTMLKTQSNVTPLRLETPML